MKIPTTLKIGGHKFIVTLPYYFTQNNGIDAQLDFNAKEIRIANSDNNGLILPDSTIMVNLIHEILHAIDLQTGHKIFDNNEAAIEGFSEGLYQVLVDNKLLKGGD